jgi:aspartate racemase
MRRFICCVKRGNLKAGFSLRVMLKQAHISMATSGFVTEDQRAIFNAVSHRLLEDQGAEAIMLGGTDLALAFNEQTAEFPLVDCAGIHADAIAQLAIA